MRMLIKLGVLLAVLWCGWWALATYGATQALNGLIENRRAAGWEVEAETAQGGFPMNIQTSFAALSASNAASQSTLTMKGGAVRARTYWPGHIDIDLPETPITLDLPGGQIALETKNAKAALRLRPGFALELGSVRINSDGWRVMAYDKELLLSKDFTLLADQDATNNAQYAVTLAATGLTPGALPRQMLSLPANWPPSFESFTATGNVTFDGPLTRSSLEDTPPNLRGLTVQEADVIWGPLALRASGDLAIDANGIPTGSMNIEARNWRGLLDLMQGAGMLPAKQRGQAELMLGLLAGRSGRPEDMDLDLVFERGRMSISGIPLGSAPRLTLR